MVGSTALWTFSNIRFNAVMGGLLAVWMFVSFLASETLLPVMISYFRPRFILREAVRAQQRPAVAATAAAVSQGAAMGLWESAAIVVVFSIGVIVAAQL